MTPAIKAIIIANVVVFVATWMLGTDLNPSTFRVIDLFGLQPRAVFHGQIWQVVTYLFLHAGLWHLLFNMLALWMFGV
jgi:membrane associated rhomboid family serine protease